MKDNLIKAGIMLVTMGLSVCMWVALLHYFPIQKETTIIERQCTTTPETMEIQVVEMPDGWRCEVPKSDMEIVQPSGLWGMATIRCQKLLMPIEEWCSKNPCSRNKTT